MMSCFFLTGIGVLAGFCAGWFLKHWVHSRNIEDYEKDTVVSMELKKFQKKFPFPFSFEAGSKCLVSEITMCPSKDTKNSGDYVQKRIVTEISITGNNRKNLKEGAKKVLIEHALSISKEADSIKDTAVYSTVLQWLSGTRGN